MKMRGLTLVTSQTAKLRKGLGRLGMLALRLIAVCAGTAISLGLCAALIWRFRPACLSVNTVALRGCELTTPGEVLAELDWHPGCGLPVIGALWAKPDLSALPWIASAGLVPSGIRSLTVQVSERHPLTRIKSASGIHWICDDGALVPVVAARDADLLEALKSVPLMVIPAGVSMPQAAELLQLAEATAACNLNMPGKIASLSYDAKGEVELTHLCGLPIRLGGLDGITERIAALPKVLRGCEATRAQLRGIDASDPCVFYKQWRAIPPKG
jgi:cell division septal protein FtsQ